MNSKSLMSIYVWGVILELLHGIHHQTLELNCPMEEEENKTWSSNILSFWDFGFVKAFIWF